MEFKSLLPSDANAAEALARHGQWPFRAEDWLEILQISEGIAAWQSGVLIGAGVAWTFGEEFGAIGTIMIAPTTAPPGLESTILGHLMDRLGNRSVWAHVPESSVASYKRFGFQRDSTKLLHQGTASMAPLLAMNQGDRIRPLGRNDSEALQLLDERASGVPRGDVIDQWLQEKACVVLENEGLPQGYAFCRESGPGVIIGPVAAPTIEGAKALISHWINTYARKTVRIDVPADSGLSDWLDSVGVRQTQAIVTMIRGKPFLPSCTPRLWAMMVNPIS